MARGTLPTRPPRDQRLDLLRGWMQISIFVSHVAGARFVWGIHATWGLSDSSEQFVLLSGLTLGSVFALKMARDGFRTARTDLLRRTLRLYGTHLAVLCAFAVLVPGAEATRLLPGEAARLHWTPLVERPWVALPAAAAMLYQPDLMGILPVFVCCMLLLPGFLWLADRAGAWALLPPAALYAAVQAGWAATPAPFENGIAFDPLAWQLLFLLGAWIGHRGLLHGGPVLPRSTLLLGGAAAVVLFGFWARLVGHGLLPGPALAAEALAHKEVLAAADRLDLALARNPRALLLVKLSHTLRFMAGDTPGMLRTTRAALRACPPEVAGHGFLLGCHAFALGEAGDLAGAERFGRRAVEREPRDAWALHAVAHVHETRGQAEAAPAPAGRPLRRPRPRPGCSAMTCRATNRPGAPEPARAPSRGGWSSGAAGPSGCGSAETSTSGIRACRVRGTAQGPGQRRTTRLGRAARLPASSAGRDAHPATPGTLHRTRPLVPSPDNEPPRSAIPMRDPPSGAGAAMAGGYGRIRPSAYGGAGTRADARDRAGAPIPSSRTECCNPQAEPIP